MNQPEPIPSSVTESSVAQSSGAGAAIGLLTSLLGDRSVKKSVLATLLGGVAGAGVGIYNEKPWEVARKVGEINARHRASAERAAREARTVNPATAAAAGLLPIIGPAAHAKAVTGDWGDAGLAALSSMTGGSLGSLSGKLVGNSTPKRALLASLLPLIGSAGGAATGAHFINKDAATIDDILPDDGVTGFLADVANMPSARRRAGRAAALAEAYQDEAGLTVSNPTATRAVSGLLASLLGGAAGFTVGGMNKSDESPTRFAGAAIGAAAGGLTSSIVNAVLRRREIKRIKEEVMRRSAAGETPVPLRKNRSYLAALANGRHQQGRADVAEALAFGRKSFGRDRAVNAVEAAANLPILRLPLAGVNAVKSVVDWDDAGKRIEDAMPRPSQLKNI